jgi:hypothetical protein
MIPIAAPDKSVFFKDAYNRNWDLVSLCLACVRLNSEEHGFATY